MEHHNLLVVPFPDAVMKSYISKEVQTEEILPMRRKLNLNSSDLFSTPPSELRREISHLRGEICETHEFHDLEIKILQEEHNLADSKHDITIAELQKSLKNAEDVILDSKKEISHLKTVIQELREQLKEESDKSLNLKENYEHRISELQLTLKKKSLETENWEKDKNDYECYIRSLRTNYERKIDELRIALEHSCEKNNGNKEKSVNVSETKLNNENDKAEELSEIRCTFEEEIKKLKDEHNNAVKSFELINADLQRTNESLTEKLREANETVEGLREQLRILEDKTELLRSHARITKMNDSAGNSCSDDLETSGGRIVDSLLEKGKPETVRKEFDGYKISENKDGFHLVHKTVRYLGALCSQLEESGSSLNLSNSSFESFNEDLPSSTLMEDFTEVEISAVNDATVCNDPLALTKDNTLQTPFKTPITAQKNPSKIDFKTPLNSISKPLRMPLKTPVGNARKQIYLTTPGVTECERNINETEVLQLKTSLALKDKEICEIKDTYVKKMSHSEEILTNSLKSISLLEERISKLENISTEFKLKREMLTAENCNVKELLNRHVEEMAEIKRKLIVEITSLNPQLDGTLTDVCVSTLLNIFLNSIMESCKKMPEELSQKLLIEIKALSEKTEMYEGKLFESEKEIDVLKEARAALLSEKDEMEKQMSIRDDEIRVLRLESSELQSLRAKVKDLEERLEKSDEILKTEVYLRENTLKDIQKLKNFFENIENDNNDLKLKLERADKTIEDLKINLMRARKEHICVVTKEELAELQGDEEPINTLESVLDKYKEVEMSMRCELEALNSKLTACETELTAKIELIERVTVSLEEANKSKVECEKIISELEGKLRDVEKENNALKSLESVLKECEDKNKSLSGELENLNLKLKSTEIYLMEKTEFIARITARVEEAKDNKEKDEKIISELRAQAKELESTVDRMIKENENTSEKVKNLDTDLTACKAEVEQKNEVISRIMSEREQARHDKNVDEGIISELRAQVDRLEMEITRLREFESTFEKLKEIECNMFERMDVVDSRLSICESDLNEKILTITGLCMEIDEARKIKVEDDKIISGLKTQVEETERERIKVEELELMIKKLKESEEVLSGKVKDLSARLSVAEVALKENLQLVAETKLKLEQAECSNRENTEIILELKKQLKNLENEKTKVEELQYIVKDLKEIEKTLLGKVEHLRSELKSAEEEKRELQLKIVVEMEETSKTKAKNEEIMELLRLKIEEFDFEKAKLEEFEATVVKLKEKEKVMSERMENLNSRLLVSEAVLNEKTETLAQMCDQIAEAKLIKEENDNTISALREELEILRNLQRSWDAAHHERNEKENLIADLHNKLNELNSEIECLREKLGQAEINLKLHEEKVIRLGEIESDLIAYEKMVDDLKRDCEKMKELETYLFKVTNELEKRNKELEDTNNDLLQKNLEYKKLSERNADELKLLRESLSSTEDMVKLNKEKSEKLLAQLDKMQEEASEMKKAIADLNTEVTELRKFKSESFTKFRVLEQEKEILAQNLKDVQAKRDEMLNTILKIGSKLDCSLSNGHAGTTEWLNLVAERVDKLLLVHSEEVESLRQEVNSSKETINNLQTEIDNLSKKVVNEIKTESFVKPREIFFERMTPLKSTPIIERSRIDVSPPHKSRRLEKLENLNDLLNGTLQKIITALNIPITVNFFSVDCYESSETQVMKYITNMKFSKTDACDSTETKSQTNTTERYEDMRRFANELKTCLSDVVKYLGLSEEVVSSNEIISQIEKIKCEVKAELLERIAVLRQDNQHLDDDNNLLQRETKKLVDAVTSNKIKISALEKSEEFLKAEIENLKSELLKYQGKSKINRKTDLCNRKLDRLEELHQSLVDLLKKILTMMEMENVQKLNLFTPRTFHIESRKIFDHVNNWMLKKSKEVQDLKTQITELDEECESYAKKIKEDMQQIYKAWEEVRTLELDKGKLEEEVKALKCDLKKLQVDGNPVRASGTGTDWKKEVENLKEKNISLKAEITALNNELAQSKKQREELDEECESLAVTVKQEVEQRIKIWEDFQKELKTLNDRIEKLEKEKKCLESEKEELAKEMKVKENGTNSNCQDVKDGLKCNCHKQTKEVKELRSAVIFRDMRILELEQMNERNVVRKTQMKALENSLSATKKKLAEENEVNQKLQAEIKELSSQKGSPKESEILRKLRMRDCGVAAVNQIEEKEKLQKLEKDNRMLKELCRTRYNEIKRLETENLSLKGHERMTKNSNQMDSPIRTRAYNKTLKKY